MSMSGALQQWMNMPSPSIYHSFYHNSLKPTLHSPSPHSHLPDFLLITQHVWFCECLENSNRINFYINSHSPHSLRKPWVLLWWPPSMIVFILQPHLLRSTSNQRYLEPALPLLHLRSLSPVSAVSTQVPWCMALYPSVSHIWKLINQSDYWP